MQMDQKVLAERIRAAISAWNEKGDLSRLLDRFRDDAVLSSPTAENADGTATEWLHGREEIARHLNKFRTEHPGLKLARIFVGRQFYSVLLSDGRDYLIHVEPDQSDGKIRRMIICRCIEDHSWQNAEAKAS